MRQNAEYERARERDDAREEYVSPLCSGCKRNFDESDEAVSVEKQTSHKQVTFGRRSVISFDDESTSSDDHLSSTREKQTSLKKVAQKRQRKRKVNKIRER